MEICGVLANGLLRPWLPKKSGPSESTEPPETAATGKKSVKTPGKPTTGGAASSVIDPNATQSLKRALEVIFKVLKL